MPPDRTFKIEFDMSHPVAGLDQRRTLTNPRIGKLHAISGLAEMDFLFVAYGCRRSALRGGGNGRFRLVTLEQMSLAYELRLPGKRVQSQEFDDIV